MRERMTDLDSVYGHLIEGGVNEKATHTDDDGWDEWRVPKDLKAVAFAVIAQRANHQGTATLTHDADVARSWESMDSEEQSDLVKAYKDIPEVRDQLRGDIIPFYVLEGSEDIRTLHTGDKIFTEKKVRDANRKGAGFPQHIKDMIRMAEPMTKEEEEACFEEIVELKSMRKVDPEANDVYVDLRGRIALANIDVAVSSARRYKWASYRNPLLEVDDLFQSAWKGIMLAVNKWDPERGKNTRFGGLACVMANTAVQDCVSANGNHGKVYTLTRRKAVLAGALTRWTDELMVELGRRPTIQDLWTYCKGKWEFEINKGMTIELLKDLWTKPQCMSLDDTGEESDDDVHERLIWEEPDDCLDELVETMLSCSGLTQKERDCVEARYHFHTDDIEIAHGNKLGTWRDVCKFAGVSKKLAQQYVGSGVNKMQANALNISAMMDGFIDLPDNRTHRRFRDETLDKATETIQSNPQTVTEPVIYDGDGNPIVAKPKPKVMAKPNAHLTTEEDLMDAMLGMFLT